MEKASALHAIRVFVWQILNLLLFLDSDDEWLPTKLEKQVHYLNQNPHLSMVHTNELWIRSGQSVKQSIKHQKFGGRIFSHCTNLCLIAPSSLLLQKTLLEKVGLFDESFLCLRGL